MESTRKVINFLAPHDLRSSPLTALWWTLVFALATIIILLSLGALEYKDADADGHISRDEIHWDFKKITENPDKKYWQIAAACLFAVHTAAVPIAFMMNSKLKLN